MKKQHWDWPGASALCCAVPCCKPACWSASAGGGKLVIAYRESCRAVFPSWPSGKPVGYAMDLCLRLAGRWCARRRASQGHGGGVRHGHPANRIELIEQGKADLECGSTTNNAERRQKVAFTVPSSSLAHVC